MTAYSFTTDTGRPAIGDDGPHLFTYGRARLVYLPPPVRGGKRGKKNKTYAIGPSERAEPRAFFVEKRR